jgi:hypothetical protein
MTNKPDPKNKSDSKKTNRNTGKPSAASHPGMMGDGTEEQNLGQRGDPAARITKDEADAAFAKGARKG